MGMDISKLPSNSHASKQVTQTKPVVTQSDKRANKVVTGTVKTKKNEARKLKDTFVAEDVHSVWDHLVHDMIIPTAKNLIVDLGKSFLERTILGGSSGSSRRNGYIDNVTYRDYGSYSRNEPRYADSPRTRNRFDYDDIVFSTRGDAESALDQMQFILDKYRIVRVADLYDMCDLTAPYTSNNYGWTSLARAQVRQVRGGYIIELPRASVID